ncbi:putative F-box protein At1g32420 [Silene latifolia]|uniref:putative F-box protein At1g32420 n=1 Tax=Silene latifolia TaxID=37657 RepID=UPI003D77CAD7
MEMNLEQKIKGGDKGRNSNTSDATNADVPEEIQIDILSRLPPAKSLSRFKCVSKHWNDTLTIQAFLLRHSRSYDKHPKLGFAVCNKVWANDSIISFELNDDNTPKITASQIIGKDAYFTDYPISNYYYYRMSNICNDLICFFRPFLTCVSLINIKTRDFIQLPEITMKSEHISWSALGFDPVRKVFKILSIIKESTSKVCVTTTAAILTVGSKYWKPIEDESLPSSMTEEFHCYRTDTLCLNGVIYWVAKYTTDYLISLTVVAFDLNREAFKGNELAVTRYSRNMRLGYYLTSLKECPTLFIWKINKGDGIEEVEQWTLFDHKNPNAAWKKRNFTVPNFPIKVPCGSQCIPTAGGSTVLQCSKKINSECSWYLSYDLENFAIE